MSVPSAHTPFVRIPNMTFVSCHKPRRPRFPKRGRVIVCASILVAAFQGVALGAALELYETGAPDLGTASAGRAAMAADASTAAANPAGMTLLDRSQLLGASGALLPSTNFDVAPETTTSGGGGGNAGVFMPLGAFFYVHKLSERLRLGVAVFSDYGLGGRLRQNVGRTLLRNPSDTLHRQSQPVNCLCGERMAVSGSRFQLCGRASHVSIED